MDAHSWQGSLVAARRGAFAALPQSEPEAAKAASKERRERLSARKLASAFSHQSDSKIGKTAAAEYSPFYVELRTNTGGRIVRN
jgi:hypothetical protein